MTRIFLLLALFSQAACTNLFFQPLKQHLTDPNEYLLQKPVQDVYFDSKDEKKLHAWFFESTAKEIKGTVVHFHGNAQNISTHARNMLWMLKYGYHVFSFDYRGYGKSEGIPQFGGVHLDALAAIEKARSFNRSDQKLILYGQSLGGVILVRALKDVPLETAVDAVVVESSFYSNKQIGAEKLSEVWWLWPLQWMSYLLVTDKYSPKKNIRHIKNPVPTLVIHSQEDPIVSFSQGKKMFDRLPQPKCFWKIPEKGHIGLMSLRQGQYREPMIAFLQAKRCPEGIASPTN